MASVPNDATTLNGMYKDIFGSLDDKLIPETAVLSKAIPFSEADKIGEFYSFPVELTLAHGVSYLGEDATVTTLEDAEAAVFKEARVNSHSMLLRDQISYTTAQKMMSSKQAFINWSELVFGRLMKSAVKRNEIAMLHGQTGLGTVSAVSDSSGTNVLTLAADFSTGIWAGMENCKLDCFASNLTTKRNANAQLKVTLVDFENKQITVTGNSTDTAAIAPTDVLFFKGANTGSGFKEMAGLNKIVTANASIFNINPATYKLWKGQSYSAGSAALTLSKLFKGASLAQQLGAEGEQWVLVHSDTFTNLNSDQSALRRHDAGYRYSKAESGNEELCFYNGTSRLVIKVHNYMKPTEAISFPKGSIKRIGASDVTFKLQGAASSGDVFLHIPDKNGYEVRCLSDQAIFGDVPAQIIKYTGIVNS